MTSLPQRLASGSHLAAELERHRAWLRTVIAARVEDSAIADDLLQETLLAALRTGGELRDEDSLAPWLYRVAVRQVLLHRRTMGRRRKLLNGYADAVNLIQGIGPASSADAEPATWLLRQESIAEIRHALTLLPKRDREVLALKYELDWNYLQIAEHLGATREAIKFRLLRARKRLRTLLNGKLPPGAGHPQLPASEVARRKSEEADD